MLIHMGEMVERVFREKSAGDPKMSVKAFADWLHCDRRNVYDIFRRSTIDTQLLTSISILLEHNFFDDVSKLIQAEIDRLGVHQLTQFATMSENPVYFVSDDGRESQSLILSVYINNLSFP